MWWSGEHDRLFGCSGSGGRLDAADVVGLANMADTVEGGLGIWETSGLFCSRIESNNIGFF